MDNISERDWELRWIAEKDESIVIYLLREFGTSNFFIVFLTNLILKIKPFCKKNSKTGKIIDFFETNLQILIMSIDLFFRIRQFFIRKRFFNTSDGKTYKITKLLKIEPSDLRFCNLDIGVEMSEWILKAEFNDKFKILNIYDAEKMKPVTVTNPRTLENGILVLMEMEGSEYLYKIVYGDFFGIPVLKESTLYYHENKSNTLFKFEMNLLNAFINSFNIKENVLFYHKGLCTRKRSKVDIKINQFDNEKFVENIKYVLKHGGKRGYAFAGLPGVGKSLIIKSIEEKLTDFPFYYIDNENLKTESDIRTQFSIIRDMQPCVVIMEDLDSYELNKKTQRLGTLINQIDDVNSDLNIILIVSVNDTSLVHYSLIRPGRIDEFINILPPKDIESIIHVIKQRIRKTYKYFEIKKIDQIDKKIFETIKVNNFTQAEICEIVDRMFINEKIESNFSNEILEGHFKKYIEAISITRGTLKEYKFDGRDPSENRNNKIEVPLDLG